MKKIVLFLLFLLALSAFHIIAADQKPFRGGRVRAIAADGGDISFDGIFYDYRDSSGTRMIKMWIPPNVKIVRGVFITGHGGGFGDSRSFTRDENFRAFAARNEFAIMGLHAFSGRSMYPDGAKVLISALGEFAKLGYNPELANIPFIVFGSSNGASNAYGLANYAPGRCICFTTNVAAGFRPDNPSDEAIRVPGIMVVGPYDALMGDRYKESMPRLMANIRERGGRWCWLAEQGKGHEDGHTLDLFMKFYENSINLRYPRNINPLEGPVKLLDIPEDSGWLADLDSWYSGLTYISDFNNYKGDKKKAGWLIDRDIAFLYRGVATYDNPLSISIQDVSRTYNPHFDPHTMFDVGGPIIEPGKEILLQCDVQDFPEWTKIEFYNASEKLGEVTSGMPNLKIKVDPKELVYSISILGTNKNNEIKTAIPMHFIVKDPALKTLRDKEIMPFEKIMIPDKITGSSYFNNPVTIDCKPNPNDSILIAYALTAEQEKQFAVDGKISPFWNLWAEGHDYILMTQAKNAPQPNHFQGTITHDAGLKVRAARSSRGIYLYFEVLDNKWVEYSKGINEWVGDVIDVIFDSRSVSEICTCQPSRTYLNKQEWAITMFSKQFKSAMGNRHLPDTMAIAYADPYDMDLKSISKKDAASLLGILIDQQQTGKYTKVQEWFIPWRVLTNNPSFNDEPPTGAKIAFAPGYNDRDPGEYLNGNFDFIRWRNRADPWAVSGEKAPCPKNWGEIIMGPGL